MAYYNPNDWSTIDPSRVRTVGGGFDESGVANAPTYWTGGQADDSSGTWSGSTQVQSGDPFEAYLKTIKAGYGGTTDFLKGLNTQYGLGPQDFERAMQAYNTKYGTGEADTSWWGDQATRRAYGEGLGLANPTAAYANAWQTGYNPATEQQQQQVRADYGQNQQATQGQGYGADFGGLGGFLGIVGGALGGASALGLTGGGALGQGALASQLAAEASSAVPLSGAAGATAGGGLGTLGTAGDLWGTELGNLGQQMITGNEALTGGVMQGTTAGSDLLGTQGVGSVDALGNGNNLGTGAFNDAGFAGTDNLAAQAASANAGTGTSVTDLANLPTGAGTGGGGGTAATGSTSGGFQGTDDLASQAASANSGINPYTAPISSLSPTMLSQIASALGVSEATLRTLGTLGLGLGDLLGRSQASSANQANADRAFNMGAPYRDRLAAYYANPSAAIANDPAIQASVNQGTNAMARALSARDGNPTGSGRALQELQNYATQGLYGQYGNELNRLANFGGLSSFNAAAPGLATTAANSTGDIYSSIGNTLGRVLNPPQSYGDILRSMGINTPLP